MMTSKGLKASRAKNAQNKQTNKAWSWATVRTKTFLKRCIDQVWLLIHTAEYQEELCQTSEPAVQDNNGHRSHHHKI